MWSARFDVEFGAGEESDPRLVKQVLGGQALWAHSGPSPGLPVSNQLEVDTRLLLREWRLAGTLLTKQC